MNWIYFLPFRVREDKLPEFEIPKYNVILMARSDGSGDLFEETAGLRFAESPPLSDVAVEVTVGPREHEVHIPSLPEEHLLQPRYAVLALYPIMCGEKLCTIPRYNLQVK